MGLRSGLGWGPALDLRSRHELGGGLGPRVHAAQIVEVGIVGQGRNRPALGDSVGAGLSRGLGCSLKREMGIGLGVLVGVRS